MCELSLISETETNTLISSTGSSQTVTSAISDDKTEKNNRVTTNPVSVYEPTLIPAPLIFICNQNFGPNASNTTQISSEPFPNDPKMVNIIQMSKYSPMAQTSSAIQSVSNNNTPIGDPQSWNTGKRKQKPILPKLISHIYQINVVPSVSNTVDPSKVAPTSNISSPVLNSPSTVSNNAAGNTTLKSPNKGNIQSSQMSIASSAAPSTQTLTNPVQNKLSPDISHRSCPEINVDNTGRSCNLKDSTVKTNQVVAFKEGNPAKNVPNKELRLERNIYIDLTRDKGSPKDKATHLDQQIHLQKQTKSHPALQPSSALNHNELPDSQIMEVNKLNKLKKDYEKFQNIFQKLTEIADMKDKERQVLFRKKQQATLHMKRIKEDYDSLCKTQIIHPNDPGVTNSATCVTSVPKVNQNQSHFPSNVETETADVGKCEPNSDCPLDLSMKPVDTGKKLEPKVTFDVTESVGKNFGTAFAPKSVESLPAENMMSKRLQSTDIIERDSRKLNSIGQKSYSNEPIKQLPPENATMTKTHNKSVSKDHFLSPVTHKTSASFERRNISQPRGSHKHLSQAGFVQKDFQNGHKNPRRFDSQMPQMNTVSPNLPVKLPNQCSSSHSMEMPLVPSTKPPRHYYPQVNRNTGRPHKLNVKEVEHQPVQSVFQQPQNQFTDRSNKLNLQEVEQHPGPLIYQPSQNHFNLQGGNHPNMMEHPKLFNPPGPRWYSPSAQQVNPGYYHPQFHNNGVRSLEPGRNHREGNGYPVNQRPLESVSCSVCGRAAMFVCSQCKQVPYCSDACQVSVNCLTLLEIW